MRRLILALAFSCGCGHSSGSPHRFALPPANGGFDYQLGGAYAPPAGVSIVVRDRTESPAPGIFSICYVNGFQIQPEDESFFMTMHPDVILRDSGGDPVIDADWDEMLLDTSTDAKRREIATIVGARIAGCRASGFDAIEIDNLDSYTRSQNRLDEDDAVAMIRLFADRAHDEGMAIAQKNAAELVDRRSAMGTDFVIAEECNEYSECGDYTAVYGTAVLVVEYSSSAFAAGCAAFPGLSIVLRDRDLVGKGQAGYVYDGC